MVNFGELSVQLGQGAERLAESQGIIGQTMADIEPAMTTLRNMDTTYIDSRSNLIDPSEHTPKGGTINQLDAKYGNDYQPKILPRPDVLSGVNDPVIDGLGRLAAIHAELRLCHSAAAQAAELRELIDARHRQRLYLFNNLYHDARTIHQRLERSSEAIELTKRSAEEAAGGM